MDSTIEVTFDPDQSRKEQIDLDIKMFETFFQAIGNDGLAGSERAILTTYLLYKTHTKEEIDKLRARTQGR